jgi:hypothetical protein
MEQMRAAVIALSPHWEWEKRVRQMPDRQVFAIYQNRVLGKRRA